MKQKKCNGSMQRLKGCLKEKTVIGDKLPCCFKKTFLDSNKNKNRNRSAATLCFKMSEVVQNVFLF